MQSTTMLYQRTAFRKISFYTEEKQSEKKIESPAIRKYEGFIFALTGANEDLDSIDTEESEAEIKQEEHEERSYDNDDGDEDYDEDEENIEELL